MVVFSSSLTILTRIQTAICVWVNGRSGLRWIGNPPSSTRKTNQRWASIKTYQLEEDTWCKGADDNPPLKAGPESSSERGLVGRWSWKGIATFEASLWGRQLGFDCKTLVSKNELFPCPGVVDRPSHYWVKSGVCTRWNKSPDQRLSISAEGILRRQPRQKRFWYFLSC